MVFPGEEFYYLSELSDTVPILSCNSLSKRFILPGWRFGWIAIHDPKNHLESKFSFCSSFTILSAEINRFSIKIIIKEVRMGFNDLTTRILGPNSLVQGAIPEILANTPNHYYDNVMRILSVIKNKNTLKIKNV